jgi:hypothetical protein
VLVVLMMAESERTPADPPLVVICSWCPDSPEQVASARAHGYDVTSTICPTCYAKVSAEIDAEAAKRVPA